MWKVVLALLAGSLVMAAVPAKKQAAEKVNPLVVAGVWAAVLAAAFGAGCAVGKMRSIDFDDSRSDPVCAKYVADKTAPEITDWVRKRGADGALIALTPVWTYRFTCGIKTLVYDSATREVRAEAVRPGDLDYSHPPRNGLSVGQAMGGLATFSGSAVALGGATGAFAATTTATAVPNYATLIGGAAGGDRIKLIVGGILGLVSGFVFGYKWVYRDQPDLGNARLAGLLEKPVFWEAVANLRPPRTWVFETRGETVLVKRDSQPMWANVCRQISPAPNVLSGLPGLIKPPGPLGTLQPGFVGSLLGEYIAAAPPAAVIDDLRKAGEHALASRLTAQQGRHLGGWSLGFPI
jgi:hypothetical protein